MTGMDSYVGVDTSVARTVKLPVLPIPGQTVTITDETGGAGTANITIDGNGKNIDGTATKAITTAWGGLTVLYTGTLWKVI